MASPGGAGTDIRSLKLLGIGARSRGIAHDLDIVVTSAPPPGNWNEGDAYTCHSHPFCGEWAQNRSQSSRCGSFWKTFGSAGLGGEVCASKAHGSRVIRMQKRTWTS
jgi:hypothetical protein